MTSARRCAMHPRRCLLAGGVLLFGLLARPASAVSLDDLVHLKANGLGDEVLVALIETDGSEFHLSAAELIDLHRRGLSDRVLLALIATGRRSSDVAPPAGADDAPFSIREPERSRSTRKPGPDSVRRTVVTVVERRPRSGTRIVAVPVPVVAPPATTKRPQRPVYWGFGGSLRPDAWRPPEPGRRRPTKH